MNKKPKNSIKKESKVNFKEIGVTGLEQMGGTIDEEKLLKLKGKTGMQEFKQMSDNDATVGGVLFAYENLLRRVKWDVTPYSAAPNDIENADFVRECMHDMSHSWEDFISEILSMLVFGWASHEIVYKRRLGPAQQDASKRSKFNDGKIGWRKLPIRAQETLERWEFDDDGGIKGWHQQPESGDAVFLPIEKLLHFRTTCKKNNPEGKSILRAAYVSYFRKRELERIEAIGIERDLAGLPQLYLPTEMFEDGLSSQLEAYKKIARNIRRDEQGCLVLPSIFDENGNRLLEFNLIGTGSARIVDTNVPIMRYTKAIATSMLADTLLLGQDKVGSYSLASSKTQLFVVSLGTVLDGIASIINRYAIPRLLQVNGVSIEDGLPTVGHGDIEKPEIEILARAIADITAAGGMQPGASSKDENYFRQMLGLPVLEDGENVL